MSFNATSPPFIDYMDDTSHGNNRRGNKVDFSYKKTFLAVEKSLLDYGSQRMPRKEIQKALDQYKTYGDREITDDLAYTILVQVVFYSGMLAATVTKRMPVIRELFADYRKVADYSPEDVDRLLANGKMLRNRRKIEACVQDANVMRQIVERHGSFASYMSTFDPNASFENLLLLKEELEARFAYLGGITVYHFLTDLGLPVLKPDRVIARLFRRLGLVEYERQHLKTVIHGRKFAQATGLPIRYIDIVLVAFGQVQSTEMGIDRGICLDEPRCKLCSLTGVCQFYRQGNLTADRKS